MATVIREAEGMEEIRAMTGLMAEVWGDAFLDPGVCRAAQHAGGYLTGAWEGERLVGASMAFVGWLDFHGSPPASSTPVTSTGRSTTSSGILKRGIDRYLSSGSRL